MRLYAVVLCCCVGAVCATDLADLRGSLVNLGTTKSAAAFVRLARTVLAAVALVATHILHSYAASILVRSAVENKRKYFSKTKHL